MKIVFMGTPDFAVGALESIIEAGHEITAVVTQPDKAKGRSGQMQFPPVKECALKYNLPVFQPVKIKTPESVEELKKFEADIFVVAAFGQILSKEILDMPKYGCVNIHASLLPKYRGAAPIQWAVIDGEEETGVTIQQMNEGVDTGDILSQEIVKLDVKETGASLFDKLAVCGAQLIVKTLEEIEKGTIVPEKQDDSKSTHAKMLDKSLGKIDWNKDAVSIERLVRGLNSWPSAYSTFNGKSVKFWDCDVVNAECINSEESGTIINVDKEFFDIACGKGILRVLELQLEGKKRMDTKSFLLGNQWKSGLKFV